MKKLLLLFATSALLVGCSVSNKEVQYAKMPEYVKEQPSVQQQRFNNVTGSTWSNQGDLASDVKALYAGDIVTIIVSEDASSVTKSTTKVATNSSSGSGLTTFLGTQNTLLKAVGAHPGDNNLVNFSGSSSYSGSGENAKSDKLQATITARVVKVLPNHRLFIRGEKQVFTNGDEQTLILTGIIDKYRITNDDTIDSQYISDAKIFYNGRGIVSASNHQGWLAKLWELIRPF